MNLPKCPGRGSPLGPFAALADAGIRVVFVLLPALLAAGCASSGDLRGPVAAAPVYHVGERWVYRGREGFRVGQNWNETREIASIDAGAITLRVSYTGDLRGGRTEQWSAPGIVNTGTLTGSETRRFTPPLERYRFPLAPGQAWNQWVDSNDETARHDGSINHYVRVSGWEHVQTPAGTFDAIKLRVLMRLDDETFWRHSTECNYVVWYAPAVGAPVRVERDAQYLEKGGKSDSNSVVRTQHTVLELTSWSPGLS